MNDADHPTTSSDQPTDLPTDLPGELAWPVGEAVLRLRLTADAPAALLSFGPATPEAGTRAAPLVELAVDREGRVGNSPNAQHRRYAATARLRPVRQTETTEGEVRTLEIVQHDPRTGLAVSTRFEHRGGSAVRVTTTLTNDGDAPVLVQYLSSLNLACFAGTALADDPERLRIARVRNTWTAEFRWREETLEQAGIVDVGLGDDASSWGHVEAAGVGSWSTGNWLPMGCVTDTRTGQAWSWQVEHNGSWEWQALDVGRRLYLTAAGPNEDRHGWFETVAPGGSFTAVPAGLVWSPDGRDGALAELTRYRRTIRRPNADDADCPVIFNDYMNALEGDPTTEKLLPLIAAAAEAGAEYFVIDAGWYADDPGWWDEVGEWTPSSWRFPGGITEVTDAIKASGMVPGLWVEPEVVGLKSPLLDRLPAEALFGRDGRPVAEHGRYQLDLRHPAARAHLDATIDRLVNDYGAGYFKFDYNINIGLGTDVGGGSPAAGLLGHNRAYSDWLDGLFARHPDLVIENCSSGGMRVDYAQLSRLSIQSTSDQTDPLRYVAIAAGAVAGVTPEQAASWAYPQPEWSRDVNDLTLVNALLGRVHLSGHLDRLDDDGRGSIAAGIAAYEQFRHRIPSAVPFWPLGMPGWYDPWTAVGLTDDEGVLLAVWRRGGEDTVVVPVTGATAAQVLFPTDRGAEASVGGDGLTVRLPHDPQAVLIRVDRG
ncbi:alpha-galactosidase [Friedmanniella endophytica]|uniref:Alpha-galactosidase n=1 Tax=Microlunatus kandeliicorticis TaxID=1759536 RepID=A0A7W3IQX3_9ACTN|nr:glycoside hydrolase family 36 protein [Microlunatus kandeliicorticis]MBA8793584.1 alpha-galactosidase [Microlunatus kandeliicorticis]